jgi:hypothetical protein
MITNTFEQRLAYQIGVKLAQEAYLEKEASWGQMAKGVKSFASGRGFTQGAGQSFGETLNLMKQPFQKAYQGFGARGAQRTMKSQAEGITAAEQNLSKMRSSGATAEQITAAEQNLANLRKTQQSYSQGVTNQYQAQGGVDTVAKQRFIPRQAPDAQKVTDARAKLTQAQASGDKAAIAQAEQAVAAAERGAVDYGALGSMAGTGALALGAGYGAYNLGRSALGMNTPQPQVAPHQYYMNQLFGS